jgi:hypothetical protein
MFLRKIKLPVSIILLLIFALGFNFLRLFIPSPSGYISHDNTKEFHVTSIQLPFQILPSRSLIEMSIDEPDVHIKKVANYSPFSFFSLLGFTCSIHALAKKVSQIHQASVLEMEIKSERQNVELAGFCILRV